MGRLGIEREEERLSTRGHARARTHNMQQEDVLVVYFNHIARCCAIISRCTSCVERTHAYARVHTHARIHICIREHTSTHTHTHQHSQKDTPTDRKQKRELETE